jgi:hypothetical protein
MFNQGSPIPINPNFKYPKHPYFEVSGKSETTFQYQEGVFMNIFSDSLSTQFFTIGISMIGSYFMVKAMISRQKKIQNKKNRTALPVQSSFFYLYHLQQI